MIVYRIRNEWLGISAEVVKLRDGRFSVTIKDDDADAYVPANLIYRSQDLAEAYADKCVNP